MSATKGMPMLALISLRALAASIVLADTRTMSHPISSSPLICSMGAWASVVSVVVMDWMLMGASPPMKSLPIFTFRDFLLGLMMPDCFSCSVFRGIICFLYRYGGNDGWGCCLA